VSQAGYGPGQEAVAAASM